GKGSGRTARHDIIADCYFCPGYTAGNRRNNFRMFQVELSSSKRRLCRLSLSRSNSSGVATLLEILAGNCVLGQQALGSGKFICGVNRPGLCSGQLGTCASYGSLVWTRVDRKENVSGLYQRTVIKMHLRNRARNLRPDLNVRSEEHTSELQSRENLVC